VSSSNVGNRLRLLAYSQFGALLPALAGATPHKRHAAPVPVPEPQQAPPDFGITQAVPVPETDTPHSIAAVIAQHLLLTDNLVTRLVYLAAGIALGSLLGAFFSDHFRRWRKLIGLVLITIGLSVGVLIHNVLAFSIGLVVSAVVVYRLLKLHTTPFDEAIFGDAHPATYEELAAANLVPEFDPETGELGEAPPGIPIGFTL
jgi:hypothetical protein